MVLLLVLFYWLQTVILLCLLGLLLGLLLDSMAHYGIRYLRLPRGAAVVLAAFSFVVALAITLVLIAIPIAREGTALVHTLPEKMAAVNQRIDVYRAEFPWLKHVLPSGRPPPSKDEPKAVDVAKSAIFTASTAVEWGARLLATFFLGLFLAWDPPRWVRGVAALIPNGTLAERIDLLHKIASALRNYLITMGIYILAMGTLWTVGLWVIGIDYPLLFGAIGGLVEVVPYVGPLIGLIPPLIIALTMDPFRVVYVLVLYIILHIVEGYILVPYILHEREHLPPPLIVISILACGVVFGALGVILAVPLGMIAYVWAKETIYKTAEEKT